MTRGWWRIVDPDQVKIYVDALHPRGVREKELSRMLTRFMDFARESCLKVKIHFILFLFFFLATLTFSFSSCVQHTERDRHGHVSFGSPLLLHVCLCPSLCPSFFSVFH